MDKEAKKEMTDDGMKFICKKCGRWFPLIPKSHGVTFMRLFGYKPKPSEMCNGEVVPILEEKEQ